MFGDPLKIMGLTFIDDMVKRYPKSKTRNVGTGMFLSTSIATSGQWLLGTGSGLSYGNKDRS